jgi:hypothetical protein
MKRLGIAVLWLSSLPLTVTAQEKEVSESLSEDSRMMRQMRAAMTGTARNFAYKGFDTKAFNTRVLNEKDSGLMRNANNFSFPSNSSAKRYQTGSFNGFAREFATTENRKFATGQTFDVDQQRVAGKILTLNVDRDSERPFTAENWHKQSAFSGKLYRGKEITELGEFTGTLVLSNKDDLQWQQPSLSSAQIKEILNKNK